MDLSSARQDRSACSAARRGHVGAHRRATCRARPGRVPVPALRRRPRPAQPRRLLARDWRQPQARQSAAARPATPCSNRISYRSSDRKHLPPSSEFAVETFIHVQFGAPPRPSCLICNGVSGPADAKPSTRRPRWLFLATGSQHPERPSSYSNRLVSISGVSVAFSVEICGQSEVTASRRRSLRP